MKITHKLLLVFACLALLTFSGCAQTHDESDVFPVEEITTTAEVLTQQLTCFAFDANDTLGSSGYPIDNNRIYRFIVSTVSLLITKNIDTVVLSLWMRKKDTSITQKIKWTRSLRKYLMFRIASLVRV